MSAAASTPATDGWTTVVRNKRAAPEPAPPAFGRRPAVEAPPAFARSAPTRAASSSSSFSHGAALRTERAAAAAKPLDITSMSAFPALGKPGGAATAKPKPSSTTAAATKAAPLNFGAAAAAGAARDAEESVAATAAADAYEMEYARRRQERLAAAAHRSRLAAIGTRCHDDGPEDYDGPEENDEDYVPAGTGTTDDWEDTNGYADASGGETYTTVRRGDKGVW